MNRLLVTLVTLLALSGVAGAQPAEVDDEVLLLPAGTTVDPPEGEVVCDDDDCTEGPLVLPDMRFLLTRAALDQALADSAAGEQCRADYADLAQRCNRLAQPAGDPKWLTALKWVGVGVVVSAAFMGGVWVGAQF